MIPSRSVDIRLRRLATWVRWQGLRMAFAKVGAPAATKIKTFTAPEELTQLHNLAAALPDNSILLEIGSYLGASACMLGLAVHGKHSRIVCVDTWHNETMPEGIMDTLAAFCENTRAFRNDITIVRKASSELAREDVPGPVDLAFIDGDHSYAGVKCDIERVLPLMAPKSTLVFHDAAQGCFPGVSKGLGEVLSRGDFILMGTVKSLAWAQRT